MPDVIQNNLYDSPAKITRINFNLPFRLESGNIPCVVSSRERGANKRDSARTVIAFTKFKLDR